MMHQSALYNKFLEFRSFLETAGDFSPDEKDYWVVVGETNRFPEKGFLFLSPAATSDCCNGALVSRALVEVGAETVPVVDEWLLQNKEVSFTKNFVIIGSPFVNFYAAVFNSFTPVPFLEGENGFFSPFFRTMEHIYGGHEEKTLGKVSIYSFKGLEVVGVMGLTGVGTSVAAVVAKEWIERKVKNKYTVVKTDVLPPYRNLRPDIEEIDILEEGEVRF